MGFGANSTVVYATADGLEVRVVDIIFGALCVFALVRLYQHYCKADPKAKSQSSGPASATPSRYPFHLRALAFTCEHAIDFLTLVMDFVLKFLGPTLVLLCTGLILFVTYSYFVDVLPVAFVTFGSPYTEVLTLIGLFWLFNIFFNYFAVQFVGPGHPPPAMPSEVVDKLWRDPDLNPKKRQHTEMDHRYCMKCSVIKPMRTHHCSVCKRCVLKMDHHCPWVNSCVGYKNMRYFYLFLFYLSSGALFFIAMSTQMLVSAFTGKTQSDRYVLAAVMCLSASLASGLFLGWNTYLVFSNQTTIEFYGNYFENSRARNTTHRNPYFLEPFRNARQIFGDGHILTWFLPSLKPPPGDGFIFPLKDDDEPKATLQTVRVDDRSAANGEGPEHAPPKPSPIRYFSASLMPPASQGGAGYELQESDILKVPARPPADPRDVDLMPKLLQMRASHVAHLSRAATATPNGPTPAATDSTGGTAPSAPAASASNDDHDM